MIWEACIPQRVVELEIPLRHVLDTNTNCCLHWTNKQISKPPLITQVCRESRDVALNNGGSLQRDAEAPQTNFNWMATEAWFNPKHDIVAWYWHPCQQVHNELEVIGDPTSYFIHHASRARGALILAENIYPFAYLEDTELGPLIPDGSDMAYLSRLKSFLVCVKIFGIHLTAAEAAESNLWGLTGEELVQVVDATDTSRIQKFVACSSFEDSEAQLDFNLMADEKRFHGEIATWKRELPTFWVLQHWILAYQDGFDGITAPQDIWTFNGTIENAQGMDMLHPLTIIPFDMNKFIENKRHPWVAHLLETMPDFRPVIMFRLCEIDCHKGEEFQSGYQMVIEEDGASSSNEPERAREV